MLQARRPARLSLGIIGMIALHAWHGESTVELVLAVISTAALIALHLWLVRLFKDFGPKSRQPKPRRTDALTAIREARRQRRRLIVMAGGSRTRPP